MRGRNANEALEFPFADRPAPGERREIAPGIGWVCQPLPMALNHVNCWWLGEGSAATLVDTGIDDPPTREHWQTIVAREGRPETLLVTHFHPDHTGLAAWFEEAGAALLGHPVGIATGERYGAVAAGDYARRLADWYAVHGLDEAAVASARVRGQVYRRLVGGKVRQWRHVEAGDTLTLGGRRFAVLTGEGHAPSMLMLHDAEAGILIAADQVLPSISPNVSLSPFTAADDPLAAFLATLDALRALPEDTLVLPSHGRPFRGLHARLDALTRHHDRRLDALLDALDEPRSAASLFPVLFDRRLDAQQLSFALGEALAHLRTLERRGDIERLEENGGTRFGRRTR